MSAFSDPKRFVLLMLTLGCFALLELLVFRSTDDQRMRRKYWPQTGQFVGDCTRSSESDKNLTKVYHLEHVDN